MAKNPLIPALLKVNRLFKETVHPFNDATDSSLPYAEFEFEHAERVFAQFDPIVHFRDWVKGKNVVDFACGGGGKSVYFAHEGAQRVVGLDMNEEFIREAGDFAKQHGVEEKCAFVVSDVRKTNLPDNEFDGVILNDAIDHIPHPERALREAHRILKPGGLIFINFESYYYFWGHHLWDAIRIPWLHLFTSEKFRIALYKEAVKGLPNANERLHFRISKDKDGQERITYLNHLTIRKFNSILGSLEDEGLISVEGMRQKTLRRLPLKLLGYVPGIREFFLSTLLCVLRKSPLKSEQEME